MIKQVEKFIKKHNLVSTNETIMLAVSGGPDSVAMLDAMYSLRKKFGFRLVIGHFNHKIRKEADLDQEFVEKLAEKYKLDIFVGKAKGEINSEEKAREARYQYFFNLSESNNIDKLALGHTKSDQLETIIHNFVRGTGIKGLAGIRPIVTMERGRVKHTLIRPLLPISRDQVIEYLENKDIKFKIDQTNLQSDYTRNKIRNQIIPSLKEINPNIEDNIYNQSEIYSQIDSYLVGKAKSFVNKNKKGKSKITLNQDEFVSLSLAIKYQVIRQVIAQLKSLEDISFDHLKEIINIFNQTSKEKKIKELKGLKFVKHGGKLVIAKK